jgi:hypothetical protein
MHIPKIKKKYLNGTAFFLLLIFAFAFRSPTIIILYIFTSLYVALRNLEYVKRMPYKISGFGLIALVLIGSVLLVNAFRFKTSSAYYLLIVLSFLCAYIMTRDLDMYLVSSRYSLYFIQLAILIFLYFSGLNDFPLENIIPDSSSNGVTSYLIILQANYCIANYFLRRKTGWASSLVSLFICIVGYGRGSILAAGMLTILCIFFSLLVRNRKSILVDIIFAFIVIISFFYFFGEEIYLLLESYTKIGSGLYDEARAQILTEYLNKIDIFSLIFGADYSGTSIESEFYGNPHISFIRAHHFFGFPYLILIFLMPIYLICKKNPGSIQTFGYAVLLVIMFRSLTEPILFPTFFDFFYFSISIILSKKWVY